MKLFSLLLAALLGGASAAAQTPVSALWSLSSTSTVTALTSGPVVAPDETTTAQFIVRDYNGTNGSQRIYAPGGAGNGLGYWPAETEVNLSRYAQFVVRPQEGTTLTVSDVALSVGNSGGSTALRARVAVSTDGFATETVLADAVVVPSAALLPLSYPFVATIPDGGSLTVRVYPWLVGGVASGKYFNLADVQVTGTATGQPVVYVPSVATAPVTSVSTTSATSGGTVSSDGGGAVTARGVVYGTAPNPTLADASTTDGTGVGAFVSALAGLSPSTTYYVRAYATNSAGTAYGTEVSFTTLGGLSVPTVTTAPVGSVLTTTATGGGTVTFDGGRPVTARGVCVSATSATPTTAGTCFDGGAGLGSFTVGMAGLLPTTAYTARAFATNDQGTGYGAAVSFTTAAPAPPLTITVAQDGTGDYTTVQAAFDAVPSLYTGPITVHVRAGTYYEKVLLPAGKVNVTLVGDGATNTILTYDDYSGRVVDGTTIGTYTSYSVAIDADDFIARDITFQNTYDGSQAVALRVRGDRMEFYNVRMLGFQDTYYTHSYGRIYHRNCYIEGTVDFIFGRSVAVFDDCEIHSKRNSPVTAANTEPGYAYGYVFRNATLTADAGITGATLGRPWGPHARTIFVESEMGAHIQPQGWLEWAGTQNHLTADYAEGENSGPGYVPASRVPWSHQLTGAEVDALTLEAIFARTTGAPAYPADWLPGGFIVADGPAPTSPLETALAVPFPNPARQRATVRYSLAEAGEVAVEVFDALGRRVLTLARKDAAAGTHDAALDASLLPAGVYVVRLQAGATVQTRRLTVVR